MSLSRVKTWNRNEILLSTDLNAEFNNILQNGSSLVFPLSSDLDVGSKLLLNTGLQTPSQLHDAILTMDKFSNSLPVAIASIGSTKTTLLIGGSITVGADVTIPDNIFLWFVGPGKLFVNSTYTVTINSPSQVLAHTQQQVFDGTGSIAFTNGGVVSPGWFGFSSGGTAAANYTAYTACHASLPSTGGVIIIPPTGTAHQVTTTLAHTKPVTVIGAHSSMSIIESTADASQVHGMTFTKTHMLRNLTIKTSSNLTVNRTMKAVSIDSPSTANLEVVWENLKVRGFNIGLYADGGSSYNIDRLTAHNIDIQVAGPASSYVGSCFNILRITQLEADLVTLDQNACGDHAVYCLANKNLVLRSFKIRNASTASSQAMKIVGFSSGSTSFKNWTVIDADIEDCFNGIVAYPTATETLSNLSFRNIHLKSLTGEASVQGAVYIAATDTSRIRNVTAETIHVDTVGYRGMHFSVAAGATIDQVQFKNVTAYNWSTARAGTYSLFGTDSSGTYYHIHLEDITADGNSNGRTIMNVNSLSSAVKRLSYKNLVERNVTTSGFPITTSGQSGAGQALNFAYGDEIYLNNAAGCTYTTATNAQPGQVYVITGANANSTITDNATFSLSGDWTSASDATLVLKCLDSTPRFIELTRNTV